MKRLAVVDGALVSTFAILLLLLGAGFSGSLEPKAYAGPTMGDDCKPPLSCPATAGTCAGCSAFFQTGICTSVNYSSTCTGGGANCLGTDTFTGLACNCSSNACNV